MIKLLLLFTTSSLLLLGCTREDPESFGNKREWSNLQALEATHRDNGFLDIQLVKTNQLAFVVVPTTNGNIWIMLESEHDPFYKQLPDDQPFSLTADQLMRIEKDGKPSPTVYQVLRSHLGKYEKPETGILPP